jgi:hypothetical protein
LIRLDTAQPRGIVWLASYPKSGNTWVRAFLYSLLRTLAGEQRQDVDLNGVAFFGESDRTVDYYRRYLPAEAIADRAAVAAARPRLQSDIALGSPGPVMIKTHNALMDYLGAPLINRAVSAGAVYMIRNPLDVAISLAHFRAIPIEDAIEVLGTSGWSSETNNDDVYFVAGSWSENVASWSDSPSEAILVVRYEDLLADPLGGFTGIAAHLCIDASEDQLHQAVELTRFDRMQRAEAAKGFLEKPPNVERFFREGRAGQWRSQLTRAQVDRVVAHHRAQMERFGYLPD